MSSLFYNKINWVKEMYERIRELRQEKGYTTIEISTKLGIEQSYYSKLELGKHKISLPNLIKIADFYNVSIDYIVNRTDKKGINL